MSRRAEVFLYDDPVGMLTEDTDGKVEFRFTESYRQQVPRPVLGQKFEDYSLDRRWRPRKHQRLPDFFANLVPEGRLRELVEETASLVPGDELGLLNFVGEDLPGAVVVRPSGEDPFVAPSLPTPSPDSGEIAEEDALRFSLAGVQLKFSMLLQEEKLVLPMRGRTGQWIVKFPSAAFPGLPEHEYAIMQWARAAGFDVPECHLQSATVVEGFPQRFAREGKVLAVRRYDRDGERRIHQEDWNQVVGQEPAEKYGQKTYEAMWVLVRAILGAEGEREFIRRLAFMVASGNGDAHLKNWSLVYPDRIRARWSPLYDQVATVAWPEVKRELALKMAGVRSFYDIGVETFERLAKRAGTDPGSTTETVQEVLGSIREAWDQVREHLPPTHRQQLREHWTKVPLLSPFGPLA